MIEAQRLPRRLGPACLLFRRIGLLTRRGLCHKLLSCAPFWRRLPIEDIVMVCTKTRSTQFFMQSTFYFSNISSKWLIADMTFCNLTILKLLRSKFQEDHPDGDSFATSSRTSLQLYSSPWVHPAQTRFMYFQGISGREHRLGENSIPSLSAIASTGTLAENILIFSFVFDEQEAFPMAFVKGFAVSS